MALRLSKAQTELERLALTDSLTGIFNRRGLTDYASVRFARGDRLVAIVFDIDAFKSVNDAFGHPAGDAAIVAIARRLKSLADEAGGAAGRWGGDQLCAILESIAPEEALARGDRQGADRPRRLDHPHHRRRRRGRHTGKRRRDGRRRRYQCERIAYRRSLKGERVSIGARRDRRAEHESRRRRAGVRSGDDWDAVDGQSAGAAEIGDEELR